MKILITGASGLLGKRAVALLGKINEVIGTTKSECQGFIKMGITDKEKIREILKNYKPDILFNTAAITDLDFCENNKTEAWDVNVNGPMHMADLCKEMNIKLVTVSSDYVFSGDNSPYYEDSIAHPRSFYGFTKMIMEKVVRNINPDAIIIRPSILYGNIDAGEKDKLATSIINALKEEKEICITDFRPKYPVLIDDFIKNIMILIEKKASGLFNFASLEPVNKLEMAYTIVKVFNFNLQLIKEGKPQEFKNKPYEVQIINRRAPYLKFVSFEEGIKIIKSQLEENENH